MMMMEGESVGRRPSREAEEQEEQEEQEEARGRVVGRRGVLVVLCCLMNRNISRNEVAFK